MKKNYIKSYDQERESGILLYGQPIKRELNNFV